MHRRRVLAGTGAALAGGLSGCEEFPDGTVQESVSERYDVSSETRVLVSNRKGPVTVTSANDDRLQVSATKRAASQSDLDSMRLEVVEGERFVVDVRFESGSSLESRSVDLSVAVPSGVSVDSVSTANGDVTVDGVRGNLDAVSANGTVSVTDVSGYVRCETGNGDVRARNTTGLLGARTGNGAVDVDILSMRSDVTCRAGSGDVTVRVGTDVACAIRLTTAKGTVSVTDVPYTATTDRPGYLVGSVRGGETPSLSASTSEGTVTIRATTDASARE